MKFLCLVFLLISFNLSAQTTIDSIVNQIGVRTDKEAEQNSVIRWKESDKYQGMYERYDSIVSGSRFNFIPKETAYEIIEKFYHSVQSQGHTLYLTNLDFDDSFKSHYDICIVPISKQIEVVKLIRTEGPNYNISNAQVVKWLEQKSTEFQFELFVMDHDRLEAKLIDKPESYRQLAKEIYELCPDVIEQGHDKMSSLIKHLQKQRTMWFWWD